MAATDDTTAAATTATRRTPARDASAAFEVLTDAALVRTVGGFQSGVHQWIERVRGRGLQQRTELLPDVAIRLGHDTALDHLHRLSVATEASSGSIPDLRFDNAIATAARCQRHELLEWLYDRGIRRCYDRRTLDMSVSNGHPAMASWLIERFEWREGDGRYTLRQAASRGFVEVLQAAHLRGLHGWFTSSLMDVAAEKNQLGIVRWLHDHRPEGCTTEAMDAAATHGHLEVVQWLHHHREEGCTTKAMNNAAANGHLDVVRWLHEHRSESCTTRAMDRALAGGHVNVVEWFLVHRPDGGFSATGIAGICTSFRQESIDAATWLWSQGLLDEPRASVFREGIQLAFLRACREWTFTWGMQQLLDALGPLIDTSKGIGIVFRRLHRHQPTGCLDLLIARADPIAAIKMALREDLWHLLCRIVSVRDISLATFIACLGPTVKSPYIRSSSNRLGRCLLSLGDHKPLSSPPSNYTTPLFFSEEGMSRRLVDTEVLMSIPSALATWCLRHLVANLENDADATWASTADKCSVRIFDQRILLSTEWTKVHAAISHPAIKAFAIKHRRTIVHKGAMLVAARERSLEAMQCLSELGVGIRRQVVNAVWARDHADMIAWLESQGLKPSGRVHNRALRKGNAQVLAVLRPVDEEAGGADEDGRREEWSYQVV